eukprot:8554226-Pyramimonas_sp.AAC.1
MGGPGRAAREPAARKLAVLAASDALAVFASATGIMNDCSNYSCQRRAFLGSTCFVIARLHIVQFVPAHLNRVRSSWHTSGN